MIELRHLRAALVGLTALFGLALPATATEPDPLDAIRQRGSIAIGVKADYPLFGQLGADGRPEGMEIDLARDLARRLGVQARLVVVTSANRLQRLEDGTVDLVFATLGDTEQRREIVTMIEPNYYASGVNLMVPPDSRLRDWSELRGQKVCATQGAYFNRQLAERYLVDLQLFGNNRDAKLAVRAGRCVGWAYDDTAIASDLTTPEWAGWRMPLRSALVLPWALALPRIARDSQLQRAVEEVVAGWHRDGTLLQAERRWNIPQSEFLSRTNALWTETDGQGEPLCRRGANGRWPEDCRNRALLNSTEVTGLMRLGLALKERFGIDLSVVYDNYDRNSFGMGLLRTLALVFGSMLGALAAGIGAALAIERRIPLLTPLLQGAVTVLRMTPPLLQIYVVFFGIGAWTAMRWGFAVDPILAVLLCLSLYAGAAVAQALLEATQVLAAQLPDFRLGTATLSRALHASRGPISGILVNIAKATGMASAVAVPELISSTTSIMAERGNLAVMMNLLMVTWFVIILGTVVLLNRAQLWLERKPAPVRAMEA
jgi:polar amino acid transport system substrate-binding protein